MTKLMLAFSTAILMIVVGYEGIRLSKINLMLNNIIRVRATGIAAAKESRRICGRSEGRCGRQSSRPMPPPWKRWTDTRVAFIAEMTWLARRKATHEEGKADIRVLKESLPVLQSNVERNRSTRAQNNREAARCVAKASTLGDRMAASLRWGKL